MGKFSSVEATVPRGWHIKAILPFALPIIVTFALLILVGDRWPRGIAPGSGLKLAGFGVAVVTSYIVWYFTVRGVKDLRGRRFHSYILRCHGRYGLAGLVYRRPAEH